MQMNRVSLGVSRLARAVQYGLHMNAAVRSMQDQGWRSLRSCALETEFLIPANGRIARKTYRR